MLTSVVRVSLASFLFVGFAMPQFALAFQDAKVSVGGMAIAKEDPNSEYGGSLVPGTNVGTNVYLFVQLSGHTIIKIKDPADGDVVMKDSTGASLPMDHANFGFMANIADDSESVTLPIRASEVPSKDSTSLAITGKVVLICGADLKTDEVDVEVAKDKKFKAAGIDFVVLEIGESFQDEDAESFEIQSKKSPAQIKSFQAIMADGSTVDLPSRGRSEFGFGDDVTYGCNYDVKGKAADIKKLKVTYFENIQDVEVPLEITFGLGF